MENHPIDSLLKNTMENLKSMVDVDTIIGNPVQSPDGTIIIPVSKLSLGFASGGSEFSSNSCKNNTSDCKFPFGGGSGAGVSMRPVAFLVVQNDTIKLLRVDADHGYDKIIDTIPQLMDMLKDSISNMSCKNKPQDKNNPHESDSCNSKKTKSNANPFTTHSENFTEDMDEKISQE
ncbi:MAG: GerW family sporulation protein [Clostridium sp.]